MDTLPKEETSELEIYAAEFSKLVNKHMPRQTESPSKWLRRLPTEAFLYYQRGGLTLDREAHTPIERRGRLYLRHTALVFMWMRWGRKTARRQFQSRAETGTRRAASLIALEHYRRGGVLTDYNTFDWFFQPVNQWTGSLISAAVRTEKVSSSELQSSLQRKAVVQTSVETLSRLHSSGALPTRKGLVLE